MTAPDTNEPRVVPTTAADDFAANAQHALRSFVAAMTYTIGVLLAAIIIVFHLLHS